MDFWFVGLLGQHVECFVHDFYGVLHVGVGGVVGGELLVGVFAQQPC